MSRFDLTSGREEVLPEMHVRRACFVSILLGKYIYVVGGCSVKGEMGELSDSSDPDETSDGQGIDSDMITNSCER